MTSRVALLSFAVLVLASKPGHAEPASRPDLSQAALFVGYSGGVHAELDGRPIPWLELSASVGTVDMHADEPGTDSAATWSGQHAALTSRLLLGMAPHVAFGIGLGVGYESVDKHEVTSHDQWFSGEAPWTTEMDSHLEGLYPRADVGVVGELGAFTGRFAAGLEGKDTRLSAMACVGVIL
jgi:hypothetical protein